MPRPPTRRQSLQNALFLELLGQTGNARLSAREAGVKYSTIQHRRSKHADFAQRWDAAVAAAHARFHLSGGRRPPEACPEPSRRSGRRGPEGALRQAQVERKKGTPPPPYGWSPSPNKLGEDLRTKGGEPMVVRTKFGKLQIRPAHPNKLTKAAEQAFLYALSATANISLSAAAAGASEAAFYRRRRQNPAFAREMRLALKMGYERLEMAAFQAALADSHADDAWRHNDPPPIPPLSWDQAFQLLCLHEKSVHQSWE